MIRAVLDVNVFVSGLIRPDSPPGLILRAAKSRRFRPVASPYLLDELDEVLHRTKFRRWFPVGLADQELLMLRRGAEMHYGASQVPRGFTRDPDDDYLVHLYRFAGAERLVTGDADLLEADLPDVKIMAPAAFWGEVTGNS